MACLKCSRDLSIENKHFKLCRECNNERLYGNKFGKVYKNTLTSKKSLKSTGIRRKAKNKIVRIDHSIKEPERLSKVEKDEIFYEKCFNACKIHECEECGKDLPNHFKNEEGKVIARFRYSHIIAKSIATELRHIVKNINHLCILCHSKWEHGDRKSMKIYSKNKKRFPNHLE